MLKRLTVLLLACLYASLIHAQTAGTLAVSLATGSTGGNYAPKNILAIWVEDNTGKFVKTLLAYADKRKQYLNTWEASTSAAGSMYNSVDATTGATQGSHGTRTCLWDGTDYTKKPVADGNYKLKMELTDKNATGNVATFSFTKGPAKQTQTPPDVLPSFKSVSLSWSASLTSIATDLTRSNTIVVYPNPGTGQFSVLGDEIQRVEVADLSGKMVYSGQTPVFNLTKYPKGIYLVTVKTSRDTFTRKIIKE